MNQVTGRKCLKAVTILFLYLGVTSSSRIFAQLRLRRLYTGPIQRNLYYRPIDIWRDREAKQVIGKKCLC